MSPQSKRAVIATVLAGILTGWSAFGVAQGVNALPKAQTSPAGIEYITGGVGARAQAAMKPMRKDYNLYLTFARPKSGGYLANVKVAIENEKSEKVLDVASAGPLLYAKLPDGKYKVTAEFNGQSQTKTAVIQPGHPRGLIYYFPKK